MDNWLWQLEDVQVAGKGRPRLDHCRVTIRSSVTAVLGASGAGKTTLLNLLVGYQLPDRGRVLSRLPGPGLPLFWVPIDGGLWTHRRVEDQLTMVGCAEAALRERWLSRFALDGLSQRRSDLLSAGEIARLSVVRALSSGARVLVMDEPLGHVDAGLQASCWRSLSESIRDDHRCLVFATHDRRRVLAEADDVICLDQGRVIYQGPVQKLYAEPATERLSQMLGPGNWLEPDDALRWCRRLVSQPICIRPHQVSMAIESHGELQVVGSRVAGELTETTLLHVASGQRRQWVHTTLLEPLQAAQRVTLRRLGLFMLAMVMILGGCEDPAPSMAPSSVSRLMLSVVDARTPKPRAVCLDGQSNRYILDTAGRVLVQDARGHELRSWRMPAYDVGKPEGICLLRDGRIAVADTHYHRVVLFNDHGQVVGMFGSKGTGPGEFIYPVAVTEDVTGHLYVSEYGGNDRIQKFDADLNYVCAFGSHGSGANQFQRPAGIVWHAGRLYVADAANNRVTVYQDNGRWLGPLGGKDSAPLLEMPYDVAVDASGDLWVVEWGAGRLTRLDTTGRVLGRFGRIGRGQNEMITPWGLAVSASGEHVIVADTGNARLLDIRW